MWSENWRDMKKPYVKKKVFLLIHVLSFAVQSKLTDKNLGLIQGKFTTPIIHNKK